MKKKIALLIITAILFTSMMPSWNASGLASITAENSQGMPQQKISSELAEMLKESGVDNSDLNEPVRILIRHEPNVKINLPDGVKVFKRFRLVPIISASAPLSRIEGISKLPGVEYVYLDLKKKVSSEKYPSLPYPDYSKIKEWRSAEITNGGFPSDPWFGEYPAYLNETTQIIGARQLWEQGITGKNVTIAIIDTGINKNHPDLDDMDDDPTTHDPKVLAEASFVPYETADDLHGHGTHVASIAAGTGATGAMGFYGTFPYYGIHSVTILPGTERGVAPGAYLYNAKAFDSSGSGYDSWIIEAVEWAVEKGADIISGSFGGLPLTSADEDPIVLALREAVKHGVVVVIAAGNEGFGYFSTGSPGFAPDVITVGATSETDHLIYFSSRGPDGFELHAKPDIVAPGTCVVAAFAFFREMEESSGYQIFYLEISGTSMATPHVSGAAALLLQAFPGATPYSIKSALMLGAEDLGLDAMAQGAGRLNVKQAYNLMAAAPKEHWAVSVPTGSVEPEPPKFESKLNLTGKRILVENSFSRTSEFSQFILQLESLDASIFYGSGPYSSDMLVNVGTGKPNYDVFMILEPYNVNATMLPPTVLNYYVQHNGTVLFIGDYPDYSYKPKDYDLWTGLFGITWNNTALGGFTARIDSHAITSGIDELYFGNPIASLIVNATAHAEAIVWDPIFPSIAVWETAAPASGKVVVISDDAVLNNQCLYATDNLRLGLNIVKWFTSAQVTHYVESAARVSTTIESPHPYPPNAWLVYTITEPTASWISVHFQNITVETDWDYIYVCDEDWNIIDYYTGYYLDVWSSPVPGNTVYIVLESDYTIQLWGFLIDAYAYGFSTPLPSEHHEISVGGAWPKYVVANATATISVEVTNYGTYTEDVRVYLNGVNVVNVTGLAPDASEIADVNVEVTATLFCDEAGVNTTLADIWCTTGYSEIDLSNNGFLAEISGVPKGEREGENPILSVMTPMKISSTMYPKDFALHNITAFVGGGELINAKFQITGSITEIADFVDVTEFTYQTLLMGVLPDPSPAYFKPNTTAVLGDTLAIGDISAPTMLFAELQIYISDNTPAGAYTGQVSLVNGTSAIASVSLSFEVKNPKCKVLWEDYYNDYETYWFDCERLWGGAFLGYGVFEWWKLVSQAGFDVDSLHQQSYLKRHVGYFGTDSFDPLGIIAYGGYNALFMCDVDFKFRSTEISVFKQLYETGKMDFAVLFDSGSEAVSNFTSYYGINASEAISDLIITEFDKTHPIFSGVENFTLFDGPTLIVENLSDNSVTRGIAVGTDDWDIYWASGFVMAVNEMHATSHLTTRMVAMSDSNTFESLEYANFMVWYATWYYTGKGEVTSRVDTDKVAVNMLEWLDPQFSNEPPVIDYFDVAPTKTRLDETVSVDVVAHDPEGDSFTVTIAILKPDDTWENATVASVGGHWLKSFTTDLEGTYEVYATATDSYGASSTLLCGKVEAVNMPPEVLSASVSPTKVTQGDNVFITLSARDAEDGVPALISLTIIAPNGSSYEYNFTRTSFATVKFDTSNMPEGIYSVNATIEDANNAKTAFDIGFFDVELPSEVPQPEVGAEFPIKEATFGLAVAGLAVLIVMLLLIYRRLAPLSMEEQKTSENPK
ncbi:MAG: S8 family serine peptidase [Candidatus Bathyarchaeia archaeon]